MTSRVRSYGFCSASVAASFSRLPAGVRGPIHSNFGNDTARTSSPTSTSKWNRFSGRLT